MKSIPLLLVSVLVAGCAGDQHRLAGKTQKVNGTFAHEGPRVHIRFEGREYAAENFEVTRAQDRARLRTRYGSGPHYTSIIAGLDRDHDDYYAEPTLTAGDSTMVCTLRWRGSDPPHGHCTTQDRRSFAVDFR